MGYDGSGNQLTITNGGRVVGLGYVGYNISASNNAVTVSGTGSVWSNYSGPYNLDVGYDGSGNQLTITNGGRVFTSRDGVVGHFGDARNNAVTVSGTGSVWNNARDLDVGFMGSGNQLTITDSGTVVVAQNAYVGYVVIATNNTVLVTGAGSVLSNGVSLYVGFMGSGNSLIITNGGAVTVAQNAYVGYDASASNNQITLAGGSLITTNTGHGVLDVRGGAVTMDSGTIMARTMLLTNGVTGTLNMSGGTLAANTITNDGSANVVLSGGTLKPLNANADWSAALVVSNTVTLNTVDVGSQVRTNVLSGALSGGGTLNVTGTGTLRMNGTDTGGGWINVQSGATLGGTGSMASVQIFSNATLAAGNSIGTLTATNLTLAGGAHVQVEINATNGTKGVDWDLITVNGPAALSSISASTPLTVDVVNYGGLNGAQAPLSTVSWDFLDASNITGFDSNAFAFTTTGLDGWSSGNWSVTQTGNSLLLSYTAIPEPVSVALVCLLGGGLMAWRRLRRWGT
ncbi:MAG: hypothetical protein NTY53_21135 [Kiritimatiellaeota bacterium]|nr:hypothetical protein [Kiritimatiellota bacterium]